MQAFVLGTGGLSSEAVAFLLVEVIDGCLDGGAGVFGIDR